MSMKIIRNLDISLSFGSRFCLGPVDSLISGLFGLGSTELTNDTNEAIAEKQIKLQQQENQKNRDYNTAEAEKARNFTTSERLAQQGFQRQMIVDTPALQAEGMRKAGINPVVAFGNGTQVATGGSSAPSGASGAQAQSSMGLSPVPFQAQNPAVAFAQIAQGISSIATAKEKGANVGLIEKQIENMAVDTQMKQILTESYRIANKLQSLDLKYREKKIITDLASTMAQMATTTAQGKLFTEQAKIQAGIDALNKALANYHGQNAQLVQLEVANFGVKLKSFLDLNAAQVKEANAQAYQAGESGKLAKAMADTENALRPYKKIIQSTESYLSKVTAPIQVRQKEEEVKRTQWFNNLLKNQNIALAIENRDKAVYTAFQRLVHGKGLSGDVTTVLRGLQDLGAGVEFVAPK